MKLQDRKKYLMTINTTDWDNLSRIRRLTDTSYSQLMREGLRHIIKSKNEELSKRRRMTESLSGMGL